MGSCWPGLSVWVDFFNSNARDFWAEQFEANRFNNTSALYGIWIDMNEPSVFDWHGKTFPPTAMHQKSDGTFIEHLDVHNAYGKMMARATYEALLKRDARKQRPFVLTRSTFIGSQRYGAMWTGDNLSTYTELDSLIH